MKSNWLAIEGHYSVPTRPRYYGYVVKSFFHNRDRWLQLLAADITDPSTRLTAVRKRLKIRCDRLLQEALDAEW